MATKRTPRRTSSQLTPVAVSLLGLRSPRHAQDDHAHGHQAGTHPRANNVPFDLAFGVPSMRMTAIMGTGLSATPIADGRRLPMAWLSMMESVFAVVRRAGRGNGASREPKGKCGPSLAESMAATARQPRDAGTRLVVPVRQSSFRRCERPSHVAQRNGGRSVTEGYPQRPRCRGGGVALPCPSHDRCAWPSPRFRRSRSSSGSPNC